MFDWADFLALAERLAGQTGDEAAQRTAMSRAYYAAYHAAARFARDHGLVVSGQSHRTVWAALMEDRDEGRARVGRRGDRLKQKRVLADYRTPFPGDVHARAMEAITEARDVIEALEQLA